MIYQWHEDLDSGFSKYGCYEMVLDQIASSLAKISMTPEKLNKLHREYVNKGIVEEDFYIHNPVLALRHNGLNAVGVTKEKASYVCGRNEYEVLLWKRPAESKHDRETYGDWVYHFTRGNGDGITTYDPWGVSKAATTGELRSKRVIVIHDVRNNGGF